MTDKIGAKITDLSEDINEHILSKLDCKSG